MRDSQEHVEAALSAIPPQESAIGVFVAQAGAVATVDVAGQRLAVKVATAAPVLTGDAVRLERRGAQLVMVGPSSTRATTGRVTAAGNPATVEYPPGSGVTAQLVVNAAVTVAVDDIVVIDWSAGGVVLCISDPAELPPVETPRDPGPVGPTRHALTFYALDSGSYQSGFGWRTREVWASSNNIGAWFYGTQIMDTIPDHARIESAVAHLPIRQHQRGAPNLGIHGQATKPGGVVGVGSTIALTGSRSGDIGIPASWLDHLKSNPGGLGFNHGGYNIYRSRWDDGNSGAISVVYWA